MSSPLLLLRFQVRAINDVGEGVWSEGVNATSLGLPTVPLSVAVNLTFFDEAQGLVTAGVSWETPLQTGSGGRKHPLSAYIVSGTPRSGCSSMSALGSTLPGTQLFFEVPGMVKGCTYDFVVVAQNEAGSGIGSDPVTIQALSPATAPRGFAAVDQLSQQVELSWNIPADVGDGLPDWTAVQHYRVDVRLGDSQGDLLQELTTTAGLSEVTQFASFNVNLLPRDVTIYFEVWAVTFAGAGARASTTAIPIVRQLTSVSISFSSSLAGAENTVSVSFTTYTPLVAGDQVAVKFTRGVDVSNVELAGGIIVDGSPLPAGGAAHAGDLLPCGYGCVPSDHLVFVPIPQTIGGGKSVQVQLAKVLNRQWSGPLTPFEVRTVDSAGTYTHDESVGVPVPAIVAGDLQSASVSFAKDHAGATGEVTVSLVLSQRNGLPADGTIRLTLSQDMEVSSAASATGSNPPFFGGLIVVNDEVKKLVNVTRDGNWLPVSPGGTVTITICCVKNRVSQGFSGPYSVGVYTADGYGIDTLSGIPGPEIKAGQLRDASFVIDEPYAYSLTYMLVRFTCDGAGLPDGSVIEATAQASISIISTDLSNPGQVGANGTGTVEPLAGGGVRVTLTGGADVPEFTVVQFNITIRSMNTEPAALQSITTTLGGVVMEAVVDVPGVEILPGRIFVTTSLDNYEAGATGVTLTMDLRSTSPWNKNSEGLDLLIEFPPGFNLDTSVGSFRNVSRSPLSSGGHLVPKGGQGCYSGCPFFGTCSDASTLPAECTTESAWMHCGCKVGLRLSFGTEWAAGTTMRLEWGGLINRPIAGVTGGWVIKALNSFYDVLDQTVLGGAGHVVLTPSQIDATLSATSLEPHHDFVATFTLTMLSAVVPQVCVFEIVWPGGFSWVNPRVSRIAFWGHLTIATQDVSYDVVAPPNWSELAADPALSGDASMLIARTEGSSNVPAGQSTTLVISGVKQMKSSGHTGPWTVSLRTRSGLLMAQNTGVTGYTIALPQTRVTHIQPANGPSGGGTFVTILGSNFGFLAFSDRLPGAVEGVPQKRTFLGATECEETTWTSDSMMACKTSRGRCANCQLSVTVEGLYTRSGDVGFSFFTFDSPSVARGTPANVATGGSSISRTVNVSGTGFGTYEQSSAGRMGGTATLSSAWLDDTSLVCRFAPGVGSTRSLVITSGGGALGTLTQAVSYDAPVLSKVGSAYGTSAVLGQGNGGSGEGKLVVVDGSGMGMFDATPRGRVGGTSCELTEWKSDTALQCAVATGFGFDQKMVITSGVLVGSLSGAWSYDKVELVGGVATNGPSAGGNFIYMTHAANYWYYSPSSRVGQTASVATEWVSYSSVRCLLSAGIGTGHPVVLTAGGARGTVTMSASYDVPSLWSVSLTNAATSGGLLVTLSGADFGRADYTQDARFGGTACQATSWASDSSVSCIVSSGVKSGLMLAVTAGISVGTTTSMWSYDRPSVHVLNSTGLTMNVAAIHAEGAESVLTVAGTNFGAGAASAMGRLGVTACEATTWLSDSAVSCMVPTGVGSTLGVAVTVGGADQVRVMIAQMRSSSQPSAGHKLCMPAHSKAAPPHTFLRILREIIIFRYCYCYCYCYRYCCCSIWPLSLSIFLSCVDGHCSTRRWGRRQGRCHMTLHLHAA